MRAKLSDRRGITVVELIVSLFVMGIILALVFSYMLYNMRMFTIAKEQELLQSQCVQILDILTGEIRESRSIAADHEEDVYTLTKSDGGTVIVRFDRSAERLTITGVSSSYDNIADFKITVDPIGGICDIYITSKLKSQVMTFKTAAGMRNFND